MYSREQPRFLHRIKNLPSIEIIKQLNMLCEGSENTYDARNHVLTINSLD